MAQKLLISPTLPTLPALPLSLPSPMAPKLLILPIIPNLPALPLSLPSPMAPKLLILPIIPILPTLPTLHVSSIILLTFERDGSVGLTFDLDVPQPSLPQVSHQATVVTHRLEPAELQTRISVSYRTMAFEITMLGS